MSKANSDLNDLPVEFLGKTDPCRILKDWIKEAEDSGLRDANAMTLATVDKNSRPHARVVLCKEILGNSIFFYTNYESHKGQQLEAHHSACINFFWHQLHRQVRLNGQIKKVPYEKSAEYWSQRPRGSQLAQLTSKQSQLVTSRQQMEDELRKTEQAWEGKEIPCPKNWGGYEMIVDSAEMWIGRDNRFHDRILFTKVEDHWSLKRLYP